MQLQCVLRYARRIGIGGGEHDPHEGEGEREGCEDDGVRLFERGHYANGSCKISSSSSSEMLRPLAMNPMRDVASSTRSFVIAA